MENVSAGLDSASSSEPHPWFSPAPAKATASARWGSADTRRAPGWFDSSWELRRGLEVREGLPEGTDFGQWPDLLQAQIAT